MSIRLSSQLQRLWFQSADTLSYPLHDVWRRGQQVIALKGAANSIVNQKEIRVVGMRRTGNHAIISWIEHQLLGKYWHLNNIERGRNPYRRKADKLKRYHPEYAKMSQVYRRQGNGEFVHRDCLLYSYEDWSLAQIARGRVERNRALYLGKSAQCLDVLILRDPFNLFASRLKQGFVPTKDQRLSMVEMWLEYAKEFVGESHYLQRNLVCINYNQWFQSQDYRRKLASQIGVPFSDAGLTTVSDIGGGSSFDGTNLDGKARSMDVTNRWRRYAKTPAFQALFESESVWRYSQQIFRDLPGTHELDPYVSMPQSSQCRDQASATIKPVPCVVEQDRA